MISPLMRQRLPKLLRLPLFLLSLAVFLNGASTPAHAAFSGSGNGSADNPYIITTPAQLNEVRNNRSACYKLGNDIDMSAFGNFVPIGLESGGYPFTGTFDGDYRTISGLKINEPNRDYVGLFCGLGSAGKGKVMNLRLTNVNVVGRNYVGGLVGQARYGARVERVYVDGIINAPFVNDDVLGGYCVGGLIGNMGWYGTGTVSECVSKATVTSGCTIAGGLVGSVCQDYDGSIPPFVVSDSYATGRVTVPPASGDSYGGAAGGLVGWIEGRVYRSYSTGQATGGSSRTGGLVGVSEPSAASESSYWDTVTSHLATSDLGTGKTTAQMKQQATLEGWAFDTVWGINAGSYPYLRWETRPVMRGSVSITGTVKYGESLAVDTTGLTYTAAAPGNALGYQWKRNGSAINGATASTYTLDATDMGKAITVVVSADGVNAQGTVVSSATGAVAKAEAEAPGAPVLSSQTYSNITLVANQAYEFSMDDSHVWQSSNVFTGLPPNSTHEFRARLKETATHNASDASDAATYTTALQGIGGTVVIQGTAKFDEELTANTSGITYTPATIGDVPTYQWKRDGAAIEGATNATYKPVSADVGKVLTVTVAADGVHAVGNVTSAGVAIDKADGPGAPEAPSAAEANVTFSSVTLDANPAYEFSRDGVVWQGGLDGHVFTELAPETSYTFMARVAETATHKVSAASAGLTVTTKVKPVIGGSTAITVVDVLEYLGTLEADLTGITYTPATLDDSPFCQWMRSGFEIPGAVGPTYTLGEDDVGRRISVRVSADGENADGWVESQRTILVGKAAPLAPASMPALDSKTLTSVTLVDSHNAPHEFSRDNGVTWQGSVFSNLIPGTEYDFIARVKETPVRRASDVSAPLTVTLEQDAQDPVWAVDSALSASSVGPSHVTLAWTGATDNAAIASYKVYKDGVLIGAPATASYTVTGLKPVTSYEFKVEACDVVGRWAAGGPELTISTEPGLEEEEKDEEPPAWLGADLTVGVRHWTGSDDLEVRCAPGATSYVLEFSTSSLFSAQGGSQLVASTDIGTVAIPSNMLAGTEHARSTQVSVTVGSGDKESLPEDVRLAVGDRPLIRLSLDVDGERAAWFNPEAPVTVTIPYTPTPEELLNPEAITVWYIDGSGNVVEVPSGRFDAATGTVTFTTTHFSDYAIVFVEKTFEDLEGVPWAKKQVEVLASKGIVKGTGESTFSPDSEVTRADFLLLLVRTLGLTAREVGSFADVLPSDYYHDAVGIAKTLGITNGVDGQRFDPNSSITRQDMMVLAERALTLARRLVRQPWDLTTFSDGESVAPYAVDSVASLVASGLVTGDGGRISPLGDTTRAEAAVFLYRAYNMR